MQACGGGPGGAGGTRPPPVLRRTTATATATADMDLRLTRARKRGAWGGRAACLHAGAGGGCSGRVSIAGRGGRRRGRGAGGEGRARRAARRQSASGPRPRGRRLYPAVRRTGVSPRAPGGGGEPRAARPRADVARSRSAPELETRAAPRGRRARSLLARPEPVPPAPRLRPVFLWARQRDGTVQEVLCEDYDPRNRIRIARTPTGWRVIPRTETYDAIRVTPPSPRVRTDKRRRRRFGGTRRRRSDGASPDAWLPAPDLESHIPSHTIAVPRVVPPPPSVEEQPPPSAEEQLLPPLEIPPPLPLEPPPERPPPPAISPPPSPPPLTPPPPPPPEPTLLDNLLAVAELEFNQQRGEEALELELQAGPGGQYSFLPEEEVARDVMSFEIGESKAPDDLFYDRKVNTAQRSVEEDVFQNDIVSHTELFESISEAHYLPELSGPHDEELLESLVEKGCEDNQILGQALDKLAHLVHGSGEYVEEEEDMLLGGAPVADIIDRLEQSLESPSRSSMTAAQGLLHLHHIGDHLPPREHQQSDVDTYMPDEVFEPPAEFAQDDMTTATEVEEPSEVNHYDYEQNAEKRLQSTGEPAEVMYTEQVPDIHETFQNNNYEDISQSSEISQQQTEETSLNQTSFDENCEKEIENAALKIQEESIEESAPQQTEVQQNEMTDTDLMAEIDDTCIKVEVEPEEPVDNSDKPTDLSIKVIEDDDDEETQNLPAPAKKHITSVEKMVEQPEEFPRDLTIHRRLPTPHASPRIDIPRAPSRESDAMQSPQPSGIPAISSPEVFNAPAPKQKPPSFLESLYASTSPKMYTSEVTITKQQCEPLNLGKHRKSASPTVSSCSDEIRKPTKDYGEPQEKRSKRDSTDDLSKISKLLLNYTDNSEKTSDAKQRKLEQQASKQSEVDRLLSPRQQLEDLKSNKNYNIPDSLLVPKNKLKDIILAPGVEIPALLMQRPESRDQNTGKRDENLVVIPVDYLEKILRNNDTRDLRELTSPRTKETRSTPKSTPSAETAVATTSTTTPDPTTTNTSQPKPIPSMGALADDIDAATSAALNQIMWLPYLSQLEAMAACSQNMDFLKALNSSGYTAANYAELSQMFNHPSRYMNPANFPMMPPGMDYDNRMQFAMWQEAMNHANSVASQRQKSTPPTEAQLKEMAAKASEFQSPYVHSTKTPQSKQHSAARTSPIANNYTSNQRSMAHNPFLQGMYPGMTPSVRPNVPLPGLQIPFYNPNLMGGSQRSPRTPSQKSPTSPYYPNNNYLNAVKPPEASHQRSLSSSSQEPARPRITVKSLQELQQTAAGGGNASAAAATVARRSSLPPVMPRRRDEPEVGSTSDPPLLPPHLPPHPHPHDPASFHLWHPLFGNQKGYTSPWSWTTVTATGD